jgi:hypothetical protein
MRERADDILKTPVAPTPGERRFQVALSFPGEHRGRIEEIAKALAESLGRERIFFDRWYEPELNGPDLDERLYRIYHDDAEVLAIFPCREYAEKKWTGIEGRVWRSLVQEQQGSRLMFFRLDDAPVSGLYSIDGYQDATKMTNAQVAEAILSRLSVPPVTPPPQPPSSPRRPVMWLAAAGLLLAAIAGCYALYRWMVGPRDYFDVHRTGGRSDPWDSSQTDRDRWYVKGRTTPVEGGGLALKGLVMAMPDFDKGTFKRINAEYDFTAWKEGTPIVWLVWLRPQEKAPYQKGAGAWSGYRIEVKRQPAPAPLTIREQYCRTPTDCATANRPRLHPVNNTCLYTGAATAHIFTGGKEITIEVILKASDPVCDYTEKQSFDASGGFRSRFGNIAIAGEADTDAAIDNVVILTNDGGGVQ